MPIENKITRETDLVAEKISMNDILAYFEKYPYDNSPGCDKKVHEALSAFRVALLKGVTDEYESWVVENGPSKKES
jgi:hypothetical protein